jgi:hypothetical protein
MGRTDPRNAQESTLTPRDFKKALYYAGRESFNAQLTGNPRFVEKRWDRLIREAITWFESGMWNGDPPMLRIEIILLAAAANRRTDLKLGSRCHPN